MSRVDALTIVKGDNGDAGRPRCVSMRLVQERNGFREPTGSVRASHGGEQAMAVKGGGGKQTQIQRASAASGAGKLRCSIVSLASRAARSSCTLLLTGETGVGKGYLAKWIHREGPRASRPFIAVNCGAIPESLIDSQLFGHARGAFSDARADHAGFFRAADRGTLLLDEISELPLTAQTRLLRFLDEGEVQPVGYSRPVKVDVRIIAATNRDLAQLVSDGLFREDLYYRLDVVRLNLKPLRAEPEAIDALVDEFIDECAQLYRREPIALTADARQVLAAYDWPGNVRELRTVIERLNVLCDHRVMSVADLEQAGQVRIEASRDDPCLRLAQVRQQLVSEAVAVANGSVAKAASVLGVHRSTVYRWLNEQRLSA